VPAPTPGPVAAARPAEPPASRPKSSSNIARHRPGFTLRPAGTARSSSDIDTTQDDHAVVALRPGPTRCKVMIYGLEC
jgi:hypothetical protein